jgi:hypothetical protein
MRLEFRGNVLTLTEVVEDLNALARRIESVAYGLPLLLNVDFADSPIIKRVTGSLGGHDFVWGLLQTAGAVDVTDTANHEKRINAAWDRFTLLEPSENRRLTAALGSFRSARRLARSGYSAHEFSAEVILNLAKTLESLFPPRGSGSIDGARHGLRVLGYSDAEIEARFVPVIALRNQIDIGHVFLDLLTREQLDLLQAYADQAEHHFRELLERVMNQMLGGTFSLEPYDDSGPRREVEEVLERLAESLANRGPS